MLHTITKRLEIYIDISIEKTEVGHYSWIFTSKIFRFALEITFLLNKYFSHKWLTSYSHKVENLISRGGGGGGGGDEKMGWVLKIF